MYTRARASTEEWEELRVGPRRGALVADSRQTPHTGTAVFQFDEAEAETHDPQAGVKVSKEGVRCDRPTRPCQGPSELSRRSRTRRIVIDMTASLSPFARCACSVCLRAGESVAQQRPRGKNSRWILALVCSTTYQTGCLRN
ncbi:hypothetical protein HPB48_019101 [Haemaphysalis longicornis]|uniref:Uncharacterized protein n=1 Tax=Haemaphysalis longicornis TaxID=44386 RepID=A0A9J6G9C8_HAELO|nr:hypothetical protein HPB48_019101 [Haemaphysalis longicornis]